MFEIGNLVPSQMMIVHELSMYCNLHMFEVGNLVPSQMMIVDDLSIYCRKELPHYLPINQLIHHGTHALCPVK